MGDNKETEPEALITHNLWVNPSLHKVRVNAASAASRTANLIGRDALTPALPPIRRGDLLVARKTELISRRDPKFQPEVFGSFAGIEIPATITTQAAFEDMYVFMGIAHGVVDFEGKVSSESGVAGQIGGTRTIENGPFPVMPNDCLVMQLPSVDELERRKEASSAGGATQQSEYKPRPRPLRPSDFQRSFADVCAALISNNSDVNVHSYHEALRAGTASSLPKLAQQCAALKTFIMLSAYESVRQLIRSGIVQATPIGGAAYNSPAAQAFIRTQAEGVAELFDDVALPAARLADRALYKDFFLQLSQRLGLVSVRGPDGRPASVESDELTRNILAGTLFGSLSTLEATELRTIQAMIGPGVGVPQLFDEEIAAGTLVALNLQRLYANAAPGLVSMLNNLSNDLSMRVFGVSLGYAEPHGALHVLMH